MIYLSAEDELPKEEPIKYPIEDLLVQPTANDPVFSARPSLSTNFRVPMDCVGDLLMIWDFCSSFARLLNLWRFSFEDFENGICFKDSNLVLIVESHAALLRLLIKDEGDYSMVIQGKKRKSKVNYLSLSLLEAFFLSFLWSKNFREVLFACNDYIPQFVSFIFCIVAVLDISLFNCRSH